MSYINNKKTSDIIKVETVPFLTYLEVGDNLRGKTIYFNTDTPFVGDATKIIMTSHVSGGTAKDYIGCGIGDVDEVGYINAFASEGGSDVTFIAKFTDESGNWLMDHYTFPDDADIIIESITTVDFWTNLIKKDISVDDSLDENSDNPVTNKAITTKFNEVNDDIDDIKDDIDDIKDDIVDLQNNTSNMADSIVTLENNKADKNELENGQIVVAKSKTAKSLENVSEDSGSVQEDPFIFQGTGTNNNSSETPTSPVAKQLEKQGNTVVVNQLLTTGATHTINDVVCTKNDDGSVTLNGEASSSGNLGTHDCGSVIAEHKYLIFSTDTTISIYTNIGGNASIYPYTIRTALVSDNAPYCSIRANAGDTFNNLKTWLYCIDLTQWFNGNIPQDLLDHPEKFSNYYNGDLSYNTGTLVNSNGQYLETIEFNQLNPDTHKADLIGGYEYEIVGNYTSVSYSTGEAITITNRKFTPTNNGTLTVTGDDDTTCIHLVWDGQRDGEYQPFVKHSYNTGDEVLRSAGSVRDVKTPDGTITRNIFALDLGSINWYRNSTSYAVPYFATTDDLVNVAKGNTLNKVCAKLLSVLDLASVLANNKSVSISSNGKTINIRYDEYTDASTFKTAMSGVYLFYELATPTTEQGTPFDEVIEVDDYGTMAWKTFVDLDLEYVEIPQGCKIFYPADYSLLVDDLNNYVEGDVTRLAKKEELTEYVKQVDLSSEITDNANLSYIIKKAYKIGNIVTLTIFAKNETGSAIVENTKLFTLASGLFISGQYFYVEVDSTLKVYINTDDNGGCTLSGGSLNNNSTIKLIISYAIA